MTRDELTARLRAMPDDDLADLLDLIATEPVVPDRDEKRGLVAAEVRARPLGRYLTAGESAGDPVAVGWAVARRAVFGDVVEGVGR